MIQYRLKCDKDHDFDSWFQSAEAFDVLKKAGHISCTICGSTEIKKTLMAPSVRSGRIKESAALSQPEPAQTQQALAQMRKEVEENSEYVGMNFATEARDMHDGLTPARSIYGEAKPAEAKKLIEDGVPVTPLPFLPKQKTN